MCGHTHWFPHAHKHKCKNKTLKIKQLSLSYLSRRFFVTELFRLNVHNVVIMQPKAAIFFLFAPFLSWVRASLWLCCYFEVMPARPETRTSLLWAFDTFFSLITLILKTAGSFVFHGLTGTKANIIEEK